MAKLKTDPIQKSDLKEYLDSYSDFSFELSILKMLRENGVECEHGGQYEDPVTKKSREFDIRATKTISKFNIRLAIECKNIRENFPLLISCIPRHKNESYHEIAFVGDPCSKGPERLDWLHQSRATIIRLEEQHSIYKPHEYVGKSTVQVGRASDGGIVSHDSDLFNKWSQCLSSAADLVSRVNWDGDDYEHCLSSVIPVLVIPNQRLWVVEYDDNGKEVSGPHQTERCSCYIDKCYELHPAPTVNMWISHIEIMTYDGLKLFIDDHLKNEASISKLYSKEGILEDFNSRPNE